LTLVFFIVVGNPISFFVGQATHGLWVVGQEESEDDGKTDCLNSVSISEIGVEEGQ